MKERTQRKGIILAGGEGSRLLPITISISKQLLPIYDKPMIYYPLSTLMLLGIKDILIITTPNSKDSFEKLLGDGKQWGITFSYEIQKQPEGVSHAILLAENFVGSSPVVIALGDNIFHGNQLIPLLHSADLNDKGATIFAYPVSDPERYGVVSFDENGKVLSIEEKPLNPRSKYAVTGLYFYDNSIFERVKKLEPSDRNELEISSLNESYIKDGILKVELLGRGMAWLDVGTIDSLQEGSAYIRSLQLRQGLKVACPEEIAWRQGWINNHQLIELSAPLMSSGYGEYLLELVEKNDKYT